MKYTLLALVAISNVTLAQTQKFAFLDADGTDGSTGVYAYTYDHGAGTWSTGSRISTGWDGWTDISFDADGTLYGYNQSSGQIWKQNAGYITDAAPTADANGSAYVTFAVDNGVFYFGAETTSPIDRYNYDATSGTFTLDGNPNSLTWSSRWRYDMTDGNEYGYAVGGTNIWQGPGSVPTNQTPGGANWTGFAAGTVTAPVPEPSSAALLGLGGLALILRRRK